MAVRPSLVDRLPRPSPRMAGTLWTVVAAMAAGLAIIALGATWQARAIATSAQTSAAANAAATRLRVAALADAFSRPSLAATVSAIAAHLPAEAKLIGAERTPAGALRLMIDTTDPDALRASLAEDPWFSRFRERAENQREDGGFRVTIEAAS